MKNLSNSQNLNKKKNFKMNNNYHNLRMNHYQGYQLKVELKKENLQKFQKYKIL